jgi:hypothetical protein
MIRIAISQAAFEAIAATLALGSVGFENKIDENGNRLIWLDHAVVARLKAMRGPGESFSDVILRLPWRRDRGDNDAGPLDQPRCCRARSFGRVRPLQVELA